jgi:gas vesicle protein
MGKDGLNSKNFLLGTIIGGVVGAATALLLAPKSGKELRSDVNDQATYIRLKTEQMKNSAMEKGQELAVTAKDKTVQLSGTISQHSSQVVNKVNWMRKSSSDDQAEELPNPSLQVLEDEVENRPSSPDGIDVQQRLNEMKQAFDEIENNIKS